MPLGPDGDRHYRTGVLDLASDQPVSAPALTAPANAVVFIDGTFLLRPELAAHWDAAVFVDTNFTVARARAALRDAALFGGPAAVEQAYDRRYHPACRLYLEAVQPQQRATVVFSNDDPAAPRVQVVNRPM